ncbi:TspO/MBR family-domain-containing protein [Dunaliella salina]|uniref:TspO/MBR family-domain-containing protein n=1 Tax=Dunaliella salina TaxID=3046 RepID=A0ABQ7FXM0_DUNSA|nr:TspO/MBR family-domain-containing protein [Dunaliella salina]|eukprot:KAF5827095.1 TspO/MBR family-domain-containing protein [Dunaliella salina]
MHPSDVYELAVAVLLPLLGGMVAASLSSPNSDLKGWFEQKLRKPSWTPPVWLFAPTWTLLYVSMGIASWLVYHQGGLRQQGKALGLYAVTLALTFAWPTFFFRLYRLDWAFAEVLLLVVAEVATFLVFSKVIGLLLVLMLLGPLLAWTAFTTVLIYALMYRNSPKRSGLSSSSSTGSEDGLRPSFAKPGPAA